MGFPSVIFGFGIITLRLKIMFDNIFYFCFNSDAKSITIARRNPQNNYKSTY